MKCRLCNEKKFSDVSHVDTKSAQPLRVSLCNRCGLIQQNPIPSSDDLSIYYAHNYRKDYKKTYQPKLKHITRAGKIAIERLKFLKSAAIKSGSLLDVGAGGGEFVYLAKKLGFNAYGIEPSIGYSEYANHEYDCDIFTQELIDVQGRVDTITIFHVLEHLPSPTNAFARLYQLLNTEGRLLVEVPWIETSDASPHNIYFKAHLFYFSIDTLISCASGFFDVQIVDTTANLKILFVAKNKPTKPQLPDNKSVAKLQKRLSEKGWAEYLFKGKGLLKPIKKIAKIVRESSVNNKTPRAILDDLLEQNKAQFNE